MRKVISLLVGFSALVFSALSLASDIQVLGLFKDKVMLQVDGTQKILRIGESFQGVTLVQANSRECVLRVNGNEQIFTLGNRISVHYKQASNPTVKIPQDSSGLYRTAGFINGHSVKFLVDTGASIVAINRNVAKQLGLSFGKNPITINTASGKAKGYRVILREITVGPIKVRNVPAVVVDSDSPQEVLLGRTFLNKMDLKDNNQLLELKQKY